MPETKLRRRVLHGLAWTSLQSWGGRALTLLIFMAMARLLGPEEFGVAAAIVALLALIQILCACGFVEAIIQRPQLNDADVNLPFFVSMALGVLTGVALVAAGPLLAGWMGKPGIEPLLLMASPVPVLAMAAAFQVAFWRRRLEYRPLTLRFLVAAGIGGPIGIAAAVAGWGTTALIVQMLVSTVVGTVWLWVKPLWRPGTTIRLESFWPLSRYGTSVAAIQLLDFVSARAIEFLIVSAHGVAALGLYAVGAKVYQVALQSLGTSVVDVAMSAMSRLAGDLSRMRRAYLQAVELSAYLAVPAFVAGAALAPEVVRVLFGASWAGAEQIMRVLMLMAALQIPQLFNSTCLNALGHPRLTLLMNVVRLVIVLAALRLFPGQNAVEMTIAFAVAQLVVAPLSHVITMRTLGVQRWAVLARVWPPLLCSALAFAAVEFARPALAELVGSTVLTLPLLMLLFFAVVASTMVLFMRPRLREVWALFRGTATEERAPAAAARTDLRSPTAQDQAVPELPAVSFEVGAAGSSLGWLADGSAPAVVEAFDQRAADANAAQAGVAELHPAQSIAEPVNELPRVSLVMPVWNGEATVRACLDAVEAQTYPRELIQVIVVDNGSSDATARIVAEYPGVMLLHEPSPGSYSARNRGITEARGEYIAFTDADCMPAPDWLARAVDAARAAPDVGIVGGRIELFGLEGDSELCVQYENILGFDQQKYIRRGHCASANWVSPKALIEALGGFDPSLKSGGDFELARRVRAAGRRLVYCPQAVVRHPCRGRVGALLSKRRRTTGGQWGQQLTPKHRLKYVLGIGVQVLVESRTILARRSLPVGVRLRLCGLSAVLASAQCIELFQLTLGSRPRRS
ncbi:oligosaccharide flippase family protein [Rivibacter subsaxonicus]|uniref:O-antigen/teichoic acid export membrane protein n=1 Tax=Rivibacter subsaxonicus TaxID=457575 RepID=A0A4Q7W0C6_9BURK|nr:oligosaccharide flippase family protein [Rivibacter subsaxonicus]RZU02265.1 O-antigen/teichoic acid export membrane protein [Rivibacter subsaxonicus]